MKHAKIKIHDEHLASLAAYAVKKDYVKNTMRGWELAQYIAAIIHPTRERLREAAHVIHPRHGSVIRKRSGVWYYKKYPSIPEANDDKEMLQRINASAERMANSDAIDDLISTLKTTTNK